MKKRLISVLLALSLCALLCTCAFADTPESSPASKLAPESWGQGLGYVTDEADILTDAEEAELADRAREISEQFCCNVYIITLDDFTDYTNSGSIELCADEIRSGYSLGVGNDNDLVLLMLSMAERDYDLMAHGSVGNAAFTDYAKSVMEDDFLDDFRYDDWYDGFRDYLSGCETMLEAYANGEPVDIYYDNDDYYYYDSSNSGSQSASVGGSLLFSLLLGFIIAITVCIIIKSSMRSAKEKTEADSYIGKNGVSFTDRRDIYTHTTVTRVYDPPDDKHSGGGGSFGGGTTIGGGGSSHSSGKF